MGRSKQVSLQHKGRKKHLWLKLLTEGAEIIKPTLTMVDQWSYHRRGGAGGGDARCFSKSKEGSRKA